MINQTQPADPAIHFESIRIARACRHIIQCCLREEEWIDCDREFYEIIRDALERLQCQRPKP
jgi:hypothetical protein